MIYVVRHGQTDWNLEGRYAGQIDVELNETGINQAKKIRDDLRIVKFDKVFSSPLNRAYKTAEIISGNDIIIDNRLIERHNGTLQGKLKTECTQCINFNDPNENSCGIEPILNFRQRIFDFLDYVIKNYRNQNILIVTHAGVAIYIRCYFEGEPINGDYSKYKLKNCEVLKYDNN